MKRARILMSTVVPVLLMGAFPILAFASVESSLIGIQTKLTRVVLPTLSIIAIAWAAFSLMSGNERAKSHVWLAILGSIIGFGAEAIVDFIAQAVR